MRVLFTGGGGAGTPALAQLLGDRYEVHAADADPLRIAPVIPRDRAHVIPLATDPGFVAELSGLCARLAIDVLVPGVDEELLPIADARSEFGATRVLLPEADFVASMLDKLEFAERLQSSNVPVPRTVRLDRAEEWSSFPCIVKPRHGRGSRGVSVVTDEAALRAMIMGMGAAAHGNVVQEHIPGQEYSVQMIAGPEGGLRAAVPARILLKRGITISAVTDVDDVVMQACLAQHRALPATGVYNIQGIRTDDGRFLPFEVNPRVSTTLCLAVAAGIDAVALSTSEGAWLPATDGVRLDRYWSNEFSGPAAEGVPRA